MTQRRKNKNTNKSPKKKESSRKNKKHGGKTACPTAGKEGRTGINMNFQSNATAYQKCQIGKVLEYLNEGNVEKSWEHFEKLRTSNHFHGKDGNRIGDYNDIYDVNGINKQDIEAMVNHIEANKDTTTDDGHGNISTSESSSIVIGDNAPKFIPIFDQLTKDKDAGEPSGDNTDPAADATNAAAFKLTAGVAAPAAPPRGPLRTGVPFFPTITVSRSM